MRHAKSGRAPRRGIAVLACAALAATLAPAARADSPSLAPLMQLLDGMRGQIKNASIKFQSGVFSPPLGAGRAEPDAANPSALCCSSNLERLDRRIGDVADLLRELDTDYKRAANRMAVDTLGRIEEDLEAFASAVDAFRRARTRDLAEAALDGLTRSYITLRDDAEALVACCAPVAGPERPAEGKGAGKAKGKDA